MPVLHLGVIDQPYNEPPGKGQKRIGAETTGDVAEILEKKYHVMEVFYGKYKADIAKDLETSLVGALENLLMGAPATADPFASASSKIENKFRKFLTNKEMDGRAGIPTEASLLGISHRFKRMRGPPRPSFIDTGLYENSFKAWID